MSKKTLTLPSSIICLIAIAIAAFISVLCLYYFQENLSKQKAKAQYTIGLLMPMDHAALRDIVAGFQETLKNASNLPIEIEVKNSHGDMNVQRSILQQFINQKVDVIVPIGTTATQMSATHTQDIPIVSLAANYKTPKKGLLRTPKITGILDEIGAEKPLSLLTRVIPNLKKITLVHSNNEKVFPEIEEVMQYATKKGFAVQKLMVQSLPDIYTLNRLIDKDSQAIFVLKDHLVVSGIKTLNLQAQELHIPVMTSDEGSVKSGAAFALGVSEKTIGEQGARLVIQVLEGKPTEQLPLEIIKNLSVFYNVKACQAQGIDIPSLQEKAKLAGFNAVAVIAEGE